MKRVRLEIKPKLQLIQRRRAAAMLDVDPHTLLRLETSGHLKAVHLKRSPKARAFYRLSDIEALIEDGV